MDLFAREFLLPRPFVRKLHLEQNLSASEIAKRLGAPFDIVAQQLFDTLLLPAIEIKPKTETPELPPNDLQIEAASHRGIAYLLEAGPGTGKTQTLTTRVEGLLVAGVDPRRILLLTFSNKAAGEMSERIARKNKDAAAAMWVGTFHAFGLDISYPSYSRPSGIADSGMARSRRQGCAPLTRRLHLIPFSKLFAADRRRLPKPATGRW
jgi:UvrD-like helicase family protein